MSEGDENELRGAYENGLEENFCIERKSVAFLGGVAFAVLIVGFLQEVLNLAPTEAVFVTVLFAWSVKPLVRWALDE
ncbi:hypothetical protein [Haloarchaeobius sp. DFWS5]|uniref:hypothetical protein n=1 Tax=Haloarchaeobius sp. DFWS5 TaxID=3446114 RepID=UPI003EB738A6